MTYRRTILIVVSALVALTACEDSFSDAPVTWECLRVKSMVDLTSSMPIGEARSLLDGLVADETLTDPERDYATALRDALEGRDDEDDLGDSLDEVACTLGS